MRTGSTPKKLNLVTLGCSKNLVDSEKLIRQIQAGGTEVIHDSDDLTADTVIINTCGFINDAKEESIDTILRFANAHRSGYPEKLYVIGCLAERYIDLLKSEIPEVSKFFGVNSMNDILKELDIKPDPDLLYERTLTGPGHFAYLKISEGCDRSCSFCSIPSIRGNYISRPVDELIREASILAERGVKELILIAQDLNYYGLDLYKSQKLPELVEELLKIKEFEWIRLHYLYPANFPYGLIQLIRNNPRICRYIDIPVQHISDRILGMMKRSHNEADTMELLRTIRSELPDAAIRTTLIAGHPGETVKEYNYLKKFISGFRFDRLGVFPYSHEDGTYSHKHYEDTISAKTKHKRVAELMEIQQAISGEHNSLMVDKTFKVIIDRIEGDFYVGRTEYDSPEVDQEVLVSKSYKLKPGFFYNIRITKATEFDLYGIPA